MGLEIIGAGFGRTGTLSLKFALEELGFDRCYHMMEIPKVAHHIGSWRQATGDRRQATGGSREKCRLAFVISGI